jgi:hypothetical protein
MVEVDCGGGSAKVYPKSRADDADRDNVTYAMVVSEERKWLGR